VDPEVLSIWLTMNLVSYILGKYDFRLSLNSCRFGGRGWMNLSYIKPRSYIKLWPIKGILCFIIVAISIVAPNSRPKSWSLF